MLSDGRALLADFGIARAVDQAGTEKLTETGLAVGTPAYMSPEQWSGAAERIDGRSDLYSLGCVTYEMLIGEAPFTGPTAQVILARHSMQEVPSLRVARSTITPGVEAAVRRAMAKVPSDRFRTVGEFAAALRAPYVEDTGASRTTVASPARPRGKGRLLGALASVVLVIAAGVGFYAFGARGDAAANRNRLVVLPFRNVGAPEDEYFSDGITEEITARLSSVASLGVIARTSAMQYRNTTKPVEEIGRELEVGHLVEGSVRWDRSKPGTPTVRISMRLIRVSDGTPLWSSDVTVAPTQVFEVQATVAEKVVQALDVALVGPERARLAAKQTDNTTAYEYYLRGNAYYYKSWERQDVDSAIAMYERATEADPKYAVAWAQLGLTHAWKHRLAFDETPGRLAMARAAIAKAQALGANLPETHVAQGLYLYWGEWKFDEAIAELDKAKAIQPSNAWVYRQLGNIRRRQGQWEPAVQAYEKAGEFDPRNHLIWFNIADLYAHTRKFAQAAPYITRTLTILPTFLDAHLLRMRVILAESGDVQAARKALDSAARLIPPERWRPLQGHWLTGQMRTLYPSPAERLTAVRAGYYGLDSSMALLVRAEALSALGAGAAATAAADSAYQLLERQYRATPKSAWASAALGVSLAMLGRKPEAVEAAKRAEALMNDALDGPAWIISEANVQMLVGDADKAMDALELALKIPSPLTSRSLALDPAFASLRGNPRFKALIAQGTALSTAP